MSSPSDSPDLKGGRPPAVKVGGMRVVQHKRATSETEKTEEEKPAEEMPKEESEETDVTEKDPSTEQVAAASYHRSDRDFPKEAINSFHVKPLPGKDFNAHANQKPQHHHIQQPRKDWIKTSAVKCSNENHCVDDCPSCLAFVVPYLVVSAEAIQQP